MYKEFGRTIITGENINAKTEFIKSYIKELLRNDDALLYIFDLNYVELYEFKDYDNVVYIDTLKEFNDEILFQILFDNNEIKKYLFINEYEPISYNRKVNSRINILFNNNSNKVDIILSSRLEEVFSDNLKAKTKTIIKFNKK